MPTTTTSPSTAPGPRRLGYDLLRIVSICGVVAIHTFGAIAANQEIRGSVSWILALLLSAGFIWAVPVFVMLSGALTLRPEAYAAGVGAFYAKRAKRIIPAIIAWTFIYLVLIRMLLLHQQIAPSEILAELADSRVYPHLYFLWLIAGLYLVAPVLAAFLHAGGRARTLVTAAVGLGLTMLVFMVPGILGLWDLGAPIQLGALTIWVAYVGYFLAGYALSLLAITTRWLILAAIGVLVFGGVTLAEAAWPTGFSIVRAFASPEYLGIIVAALSVCVFVVGVTLLGRIRVGERFTRYVVVLSEASFGVFLVHLIVLLIPYELLDGFRDNTSVLQASIAYLFIIVVSFAVSIAARRIPGIRRIF